MAVRYLRRFVVGRHADVDIRAEDEYVSLKHCQLYYFDRFGMVGVKDLGSVNGTWILRGGAGRRIERVWVEALLFSGDRLRLGTTTYVPWEQLLQRRPDDTLLVERCASS